MLNHQRRRFRTFSAALALTLAAPASAWQENPVYVDDSPLAREMLRRAADQVQDNAGEAARMYQELLDEFAAKVVAAPHSRFDANGDPLKVQAASDDQFVAVRGRVLQALRAKTSLLQRYQVIEEAEAQRQLHGGELQRLAESRSLTASGLEAMLRLAQDDLEDGRFYSCIRWAREAVDHPSIDATRSAHCWHMIGVAAHHVGEDELRRQAIEALASSTDGGAKLLLDDVARLAAVPAVPRTSHGVSPLDCPQASELEQLIAEPIWSVPLESSRLGDPARAGGAESNEMPGRAAIPRDRLAGDFLTAAPTVAGQTVFVSEGQRIRAFDRYTQRLIWTYPSSQPPVRPDTEVQEVGDLNIIAVNQGALVTFTGHAEAARRSGGGEVLCLDADTGRLRWSLRLDRLGSPEEFAELFPHGAPVIAEGRVYLQARKVTKQLLASSYVVCLDLGDGRLLWARHIASCGGIRTNPARTFSSVVLDRGELFVATSVGAIASLDPATGITRWLHKFTAPLNPGGFDMRPWEIDAPLVTSAGVIAVQPDQRRVVVLDRATGDRLASYPAMEPRTWGDPHYLLANQQRVFAIGRGSVRAFNLADLAKPAWIVRDSDQQTDEDDASDRLQIRGRVQLVEGALIVPTIEGFMILNERSGQIIHQLATKSFGNPLAVDNQLIVATDDSLDVYMPFARAERMLRERFAAAPQDPEPALALMRLAMRARNVAMSLEAAGLSWHAITASGRPDGNDARHEELFQMLLAMDGQHLAATADEGESLHAMIGQVAVSPAQRLERQLAYGQWLASNSRLAESVEAYQAILSDKQIASTPREGLESRRNGAEWAREQLADLIRLHGQRVYGPQSDFAAKRLAQLATAQPDKSPRSVAAATNANGKPLNAVAPFGPELLMAEGLQDLAAEFPLAPCAVDASLLAAQAYVAAGEPRRALAALSAMSRFDPDHKYSDRILGALVELCLAPASGEMVDQARALLDHVIQTSGNLTLVSSAGPIPAATWLDRLGAPPAPRKPRLGEIHGDVVSLEGVLLRPAPGVVVGRRGDPDRIPLMDKTLLRMVGVSNHSSIPAGGPVAAPRLEERWSVDLGMSGLTIVQNSAKGLLLWSAAPAEEARAIMLDPADGSQRWVSQRVGTLLPMPLGVRDAARAAKGDDERSGTPTQMPGGEVFVPGETLPLIGRRDLVLVRRTGGVAALSLADGATVRWKRERTLDQVYLAQLHDYGLVLAGARWRAEARDPLLQLNAIGGSERVMETALLVIDPMNGQTLFEVSAVSGEGGGPQSQSGAIAGSVRWMTITAMGQLIVGTARTVAAVDLLSGQTQWENVSAAVGDSLRGWALSDRVLIEDSRSDLVDLRALRLTDGQMTTPFEPPIRSGWGPRELRDLLIEGDRIYAHYSDRIVRFDPTGGQHGADVVTDERDYRWLIPAADRLIVVSRLMARQVANVTAGPRRTVHAYRLYALAEDCRLLGDVLQEIDQPVGQVAAIDGWLLLSLEPSHDQITQAIPMPFE